MRRWLLLGFLALGAGFGSGLKLLLSPARAAGTATVTASALVVSDNDCRFRPRNPTVTLNFGTLDPANPVDVTRTAQLTFRCRGRSRDVVWAIEDDDGLYETGPNQNRMRNATFPTEFIRYSFDVSPRSGTARRRQDVQVTVTAVVRGVDYQDAAVGSYSDVVTLTPLP